jgi:hypothetical protein
MRNRLGLLLLLAALFAAGVGCGSGDDDDDDDGAGAGGGTAGATAGKGGSGSAGTTGGASGSGEMCGKSPTGPNMCVNDGTYNAECGPIGDQPPGTGTCEVRGPCCHRSSNKAREAELCANDDLELEYRLNFSLTVNHPLTIGDPFLVASGTRRYENEQQSILWRFKSPRKDGKEIAGPGKTTIGVGRYNCDGTYSYYNDKAAPSKPGVNEDVTRWKPREVTSMVDPAKMGRDRMKISFADNAPGRQWVYTPFLNDDGTMLDWELVNGGYDISKIEVAGEGRDCIGSRASGEWKAGGTYEVYTPLPENDKEIIKLISQTYCQLVAFGILPSDKKTTVLCSTPRCMPGTADCVWKKLPDSLCPSTDAERAMFGCHLGDKANVNAEMGYPTDVKCSDAAPTSPADPDAGDGSRGQCCDPLGMSTTLPACNAYRLIQDYVAVAAEITDSLADKVQQKCMP